MTFSFIGWQSSFLRKQESSIFDSINGEKSLNLGTRIESLEKIVKEQNEPIAKLSQQLEKAYQQVQEIAVKTIEGASVAKSISNLQQWMAE